jgi:uncharacterized protein
VSAPSIEVTDNLPMRRFEVRVDGKLAGSAAYRLTPGQITFTHTEVDDSYEGHGLGGRLASTALDSARERGLTVVALCPFISSFIDGHPQYKDLLAPVPDTGPGRIGRMDY